MCLIDYYHRNAIPVPKPSAIGGFRIRKPPKEQGDLSSEEWFALWFDPDAVEIFEIGDKEAQAYTKAQKLEQLPEVLKRAAAARKKRLELAKRLFGSNGSLAAYGI